MEFKAPTGQTSMMLADSSEVSAFSTQVVISMCSPRWTAPSSSTPATSLMKRMQRVQWMQRVMWVEINGPMYLSATGRLFSAKRDWSGP